MSQNGSMALSQSSPENQNPSPVPGAAVVVEDLYKRFGKLEVLKGVSLVAHEGDVISMIGSSGSGKSTFLRCINLLETPDEGRVWVNDELIRMKMGRHGAVPADARQVDRIRSRLGMVFQSFNLWTHMTVLQNVIEAPGMCWAFPSAKRSSGPRRCWKRLGWPPRRRPIPAIFPAGSSSGSPSP